MGRISHLPPREFAEELRAYLWEQIEPQGADASGRWLESQTEGARKKDYWGKIIAGTQAMTTNDVQVLAEKVFDQTPYEFVRAVREWGSPDATIHYPDFTREPVGADGHDERAVAHEESPDRGEDGDY